MEKKSQNIVWIPRYEDELPPTTEGVGLPDITSATDTDINAKKQIPTLDVIPTDVTDRNLIPTYEPIYQPIFLISDKGKNIIGIILLVVIVLIGIGGLMMLLDWFVGIGTTLMHSLTALMAEFVGFLKQLVIVLFIVAILYVSIKILYHSNYGNSEIEHTKPNTPKDAQNQIIVNIQTGSNNVNNNI